MLPSTFTTQPAPSTAPNSRRVPLDKRKRTETSCDKCKSRKQKCRKEPGQEACRYCLQHKISCTTTQPRKKRLYGSVEGIGDRLAVLEALVKHLVPDADVSNVEALRQLAASLSVPLPGAATAVSDGAHEHESGADDGDEEDNVVLLPDQQGQVQYIGPGSSFSFHVKLRTLVGSRALREFVLFGRNAADHDALQADGTPNALTVSHATATANGESKPPTTRRLPHSANDASSLELLVCAFFDHINRDFPVLHEVSFREAYEQWLAEPANADPAWLCSFLCVLLLARRVAHVDFPEDQERMWWRRVQTLLPVVIFTSSVAALQAMLLAALHLHNTNHRDASWSLTGSAVKIAFAIGLHQDKVSTRQTPLAKELRKMLWWTLYSFEQMQVSSYDRPSAIEHPGLKTNRPNCKIVGMASYYPPEYCIWHNRLVVLLGSACRAPRTLKANGNEESYVGLLSPASGVLRELHRWTDQIPQQLRPEAVDTSPPTFSRPLLLMHAMYHYTIYVLCRSALLIRASILSRDHHDHVNPALVSMAETCVESGRELARILLKLDSVGKYDAITWWDTWYCLASSSMLVLDCVCIKKTTGADMSDSRVLLSQLADLAQRHLRNPHVPGTLAKFASLVPELHCMVDAMNSVSPSTSNVRPPTEGVSDDLHQPPPPSGLEIGSYPYLQSSTNNGAYMFADNVAGRMHQHQSYHEIPTFPTPRYDRSMQSQFMDFTINNIHDWNWGDLGSLLGNEAVPHVQPHPHVSLESPSTGSG